MHLPTLIGSHIEHLRNARRSRQQIEQRQLAKFRRLVRHAAAHSPYYRAVIDAHRIDVATCRPQDFPELTKAQLVEHFDQIVTDRSITSAVIAEFLQRSHETSELLRGRYYVVYTSGTSGLPACVVYSPRDWARGMAHSLRINPPHAGKRRLAYFAWSQGHPAGATFATSSQSWPLSLVYELALFHLNEPIASVVDGLNRFQPTILMGYPSSLLVLAGEQDRGALRIRPRWVQCSGEPVGPAGRQRLEAAFGVPLINVYSCTEHLLMGFSRPEFGGMYLFEDDLIFELRRDHTLVTNLFNLTTPLIRYRMDDILTPEASGVDALLPFTKVTDLVGRGEVAAMFVNRHGVVDVVDPGQIFGVGAAGVRGFQVYVADTAACTLRVLLDQGLDEQARRSALDALRDAFVRVLSRKDMTNVQVSVQEVAELPRDARSGKVRMVVTRRPPIPPSPACRSPSASGTS
jgi:phenylacetate-coenzyme A ligase PaaK-like adenylate-forming protein